MSAIGKQQKNIIEVADLAKMSHFAKLEAPQNLKADCVEF